MVNAERLIERTENMRGYRFRLNSTVSFQQVLDWVAARQRGVGRR